jgi:xanthine dehydrogenase YagS FAD-binding subunit
MKSFKHIDAKSINEVCKLLKTYEGRAKLNAGGTDLLGMLKDRVLPEYPDAVINVKTIPGLDYIKEDRNGLKIGSLTTLSMIAGSSIVKQNYKALAEATAAVATLQIRNVATLGGNLCQEVRCWYYRYPEEIGGRMLCLRKGKGPCLAVSGDNRYHAIIGGKGCFAICPSDTAIALTALDAKLKIAGTTGRRTVPVRDFFNPLGTILQKDEMLTEIQVPRLPDRARQTFLKLTVRTPVDFALVSVSSVIALDRGICREARIALGAVAPTPVRAAKAEEILAGRAVDPETASEAAEAALAGAKPLSMNAYKIEQAKILVRRAILQ